MKKNRALCVFLCLILTLGSLMLPVQAISVDQSVQNGCHSADAVMQLAEEGKLVETSKAVIVYELTSDTMIYTWNPDAQIFPSSMVKLMTALVALENGALTDKVVVTKRALSYVDIGSVSAGLVAGEELTLGDLLYCMMAASANDAATVIAEHIGGTQETFVKMMNKRAAELGCTGTNYTNAHGLHDEQNYTTARDICRLLDAALEIPEFKALFTAESYTVPATNKSEARTVFTSNYMMSRETVKKYYDERVTGGKTGATDEAGRCLAATAEGNGMELLTIVMGAEPVYEEDGLSVRFFGSFEETAQLLDYALEKFECRQVFSENQTISQHPVENGTNAVVTRPANSASTVLPVGVDGSKLTWIYGDSVGTITAPVQAGQIISNVQVWYGAKCLAQTDLVAANSVPVWQAPSEPGDSGEKDGGNSGKLVTIIACAVLGIGVLVVLVVLIRRGVRLAMVKIRRRRRRINRRRSR